MQLHQLKLKKKKKRKVLGRGNASGKGTYSGRGLKGQKSRSGGKSLVGFEGGQTPIYKRMKKLRGFTSRNLKPEIVSLGILAKKFTSRQEINPKTLLGKGLVKNVKNGVKVLGSGGEKLKKALIIKNVYISKKAKELVEKAGGKVSAIEKKLKPSKKERLELKKKRKEERRKEFEQESQKEGRRKVKVKKKK